MILSKKNPHCVSLVQRKCRPLPCLLQSSRAAFSSSSFLTELWGAVSCLDFFEGVPGSLAALRFVADASLPTLLDDLGVLAEVPLPSIGSPFVFMPKDFSRRSKRLFLNDISYHFEQIMVEAHLRCLSGHDVQVLGHTLPVDLDLKYCQQNRKFQRGSVPIYLAIWGMLNTINKELDLIGACSFIWVCHYCL